MKAQLHCKRYGAGEPLIILHGLFGCWDNWDPVAKDLSRRFCVYVPDLRNHGRSFQSARFDYDVMADDIRRLMDDLGVIRASLLGHSMGGKVALRFAALFPERLERLIVVDITHRACRPVYVEAVEALARLDLKSLSRLKDAEERLRPAIPDPAVRLFLLKSLDHLQDGSYRWKVNLEAIRNTLDIICGPVAVRRTLTPCLFIRGGRSDYIRDAGWPEIRTIFPQAELATLPHAGHWVHVDDPPGFLRVVSEFMAHP
jgi:pimeloyl-ACP methyl ester carboxylesterase